MTIQDLDLDIALGPGRRALELTADFEKEITPSDLALIATMDSGTTPAEIKKLSERHHQVARLLAAGMKEGEIAALVGYTSSRLSVIKSSPAMQDLIALYRGQVDFEFGAVLQNLSGLSKDAILEIRDRLEEKPEEFSVKELTQIAEMSLDRTGHGKATTNKTEVTINLSEKLNLARQRALSAIRGEVVDGTFEAEDE